MSTSADHSEMTDEELLIRKLKAYLMALVGILVLAAPFLFMSLIYG